MFEIGKTATATVVVTEANTAKTVGSGSLNVFSTPSMITLMEKAACNCIADKLETGQTSVGTKVDINHTAASALNTTITATATIDGVEGRKISFIVKADDGVKEIGHGKHDRFIIDAEKFMSKL